jgi:hypothetical protein
MSTKLLCCSVVIAALSVSIIALAADPPAAVAPANSAAQAKAFIDGTGPGWVELSLKDFTPVNGTPDTWSEKDGIIHCTGKPVGVTRSQKEYTNFELVAQWKHLSSGGNSGIFVWTSPDALKEMKPDVAGLPKCGIEVQILDHGYTEKYETQTKKKATWFTTNGDVFPVGTAKMKPFEPISPNGERSFPRKELSKGHGEWNHYYIRAVNGEVRLWVNGEEVSGGSGCDPKTGYLCLESEGAPIEFKGIRIRELP